MRNRMRPGLFEEWLAFAELEPFGEPSADQHLAYTLAVLVNAITGGKVVSKSGSDIKRKAFTSDEFMVHHAEDVRAAKRRARAQRMSVPETVTYVNDMMALMGGTVPGDLRRLSHTDLKLLPPTPGA